MDLILFLFLNFSSNHFHIIFCYNIFMLNDIEQKVFRHVVKADDFVSSLDLSIICDVSINTIRKTVDNINSILADKGCYIDSKISSGYRLIITDEEYATDFIQQYLTDIERFNYLDVTNLKGAYTILGKLCGSKEYISIEKLMNTMYCSKSTIFRIMENVKLLAESYRINLKNKRNYGFYLEADEWAIRSCMIFLEKVNHHSGNIFNNYNSIDFDLLNNNEIRKSIKATVINNINDFSRSSHIQLPGANLYKIIDYIILSHTRRKYSPLLGFSEEMNKLAKSLPTYSLAKKINADLPKRFSESIIEQDNISLSAMLSCCLSIINPKIIPDKYLTPIKIETEEMIDFLTKYFDIKYCFTEDFKQQFYCYLHMLNIRKSFNYVNDMEGVFPSIRLGLMSSDICSLFALYYNIKHNIILHERDLIDVYYIFNTAYYKANVNQQALFPKVSAALSLRNGYFDACNTKERLLKLYPNSFNKIDIVEISQLNSVNNYDILMTNYNPNSEYIHKTNINKTIKIGNIHDNDAFKSVSDYFHNLIISESKKLLTEENIIHSSFRNKEDVYQAIYSRHKDEVGSENSFIKDLYLRDNFVSFEKRNSIVMICPLAYKTNKPVFDVYINDIPIIWNQSKNTIFIFYSRGLGSKYEIAITSYLLQQFLYQHPFFINTMRHKTYREIIRSFNF